MDATQVEAVLAANPVFKARILITPRSSSLGLQRSFCSQWPATVETDLSRGAEDCTSLTLSLCLNGHLPHYVQGHLRFRHVGGRPF